MEELYKQSHEAVKKLNEIIVWYQNQMTDLRWMPQHLRDKIPNIEEIKERDESRNRRSL